MDIKGKKKADYTAEPSVTAGERIRLKSFYHPERYWTPSEADKLFCQEMVDLQKEEKVRSNYMFEVQNDFALSRTKVIQLLVGMSEYFHWMPNTIYLFVSLMDRFLCERPIGRGNLLLLGLSCLSLASKYEETIPCSVELLCESADNTYSTKEVTDMESEVLNTLQGTEGSINGPTIWTFLSLIVRAAKVDYRPPLKQKVEYLSYYLADLTLLDYGMLRFKPSEIAAASIFLAIIVLHPRKKPWTLAMQYISYYRPSELEACVRAIHHLHSLSYDGTDFIQQKYMSFEFEDVASLTIRELIEVEYFED